MSESGSQQEEDGFIELDNDDNERHDGGERDEEASSSSEQGEYNLDEVDDDEEGAGGEGDDDDDDQDGEAPKSSVIYIGHLPHGFYEKEMGKYFSQFGRVKNVKVARSRKTGGSKGYGWVEFHDAVVAGVAAKTMDDYMMFKKKLVCKVVENPPQGLFRGSRNPPGPRPPRMLAKMNAPATAEMVEERKLRAQERLKKREAAWKAKGIEFSVSDAANANDNEEVVQDAGEAKSTTPASANKASKTAKTPTPQSSGKKRQKK